jgi:hypothetical protein
MRLPMRSRIRLFEDVRELWRGVGIKHITGELLNPCAPMCGERSCDPPPKLWTSAAVICGTTSTTNQRKRHERIQDLDNVYEKTDYEVKRCVLPFGIT